MRIITLSLAIIIFITAVVWSRQVNPQSALITPNNSLDQLSHQATQPGTSSIPTIITPSAFPSPTFASPTNAPTLTQSPNAPIGTSVSLIYPGAQLINDDGKKTTYQVNQPAEKVGLWYKQQAEDTYNVTNYINLTTNDETTITFKATDSQTSSELEVTIIQLPEQATTITINQ